MSTDPNSHLAPTPSMTGSRPVIFGNLLGVMAMVTYATSFPLADMLLQSWSPLFLITARMTLAALSLALVWVLLERPGRLGRAQWRAGLITGGLGFGVSAYAILVAQKMTDPVTAALITACAPIAGAVIEWNAGTRRLTYRFLLGLVATVVGGVIATGASAGAEFGLGAALAVFATVLWTWASMAAVRDLPTLSPLGRTALTFSGGMVVLWIAAAGALMTGQDLLPVAAITWDEIELLLLYAIVGMGVSQALWLATVGKLGVAVASFHMNLVPFYVMLIMIALGASWYWQQAWGAALVVGGVLIAQARAPKRRR